MTTSKTRTLRHVAGRLALLVSASLITFLFAELVARLLLPPPQIVEVSIDPGARQRLEQEKLDPLDERVETTSLASGLYLSTPTGDRLRANTRVVIENHHISHLTTEVRTNSIGYRNAEIVAKSATRVLFLGDSITMGDYLPEEATFVRRVEALAREQGEPLETINAGISGISLANELAILVESGIALEPDVVVVGFFLNDGMNSLGVRIFVLPPWLRKSYFLQHVAHLLSVHFRVVGEDDARKALVEPTYLRAKRALPIGPGDPLRDRGAFFGKVLDGLLWWGHAWLEESWQQIPSLFAELKRLSIQHRFTPLVVCFPVRLQVEAEFVEDYPQRMLKQACEKWDIPVLDMLAPLREAHRQGSEPLYFDSFHHTARGNELIARQVLDFVRAHVQRR